VGIAETAGFPAQKKNGRAGVPVFVYYFVMIAVIFEVVPAPGRKQEYLDLAAELRPALEKMDGFISIERFESLTNPGKVLSLSIWRDEEAVKRWRQIEAHRTAQAKGRGGIFTDYRLRVASVIRDYGMFERGEAPPDSREFHDSKQQ
jgi:heme-degrading monooxygenase HmoA